MKRINRFSQPIAILSLLCLFAADAHADEYKFFYDAAGNRTIAGKAILFRGEESQDSDKKPRRQDLSLRHITIYPNPTQGQLSIEITGAESFEGASITIYGSGGSIVYYDSDIAVVNEINLTPCPNGIYLLIIRIDGETSSWKIIKI